MPSFSINGRLVGDGAPCYIIAEAGVNHNGDLGLARRLIDAAHGAGADAVKFQTFKAERLVTASAPKAEYQREHTARDESQLDMLRKLELSEPAHRELLAYSSARGIQFLSTPFEETSADFLQALGVPAFKLPSGELTNLPLLGHVARMGRPMLVSTGMADLHEVEAAVACIRQHGNPPLILLHCVSNYPASASDANLRAMATMAAACGVPVGYSDHTEGNEVALAAVALGACVIEKHLTLDRTLPGPDHQASLEPAEFAAAVRAIRRVEGALGHGRKEPAPSEAGIAAVARKSIVTTRALPAGTRLTAADVALRRPGTGLPPAALPDIVGRVVRVPLAAGAVVQRADLE
jgi:N-acetylneuraminate synthase